MDGGGGIICLMVSGIFIFAIIVLAKNYYSPSASSGSRTQHNDNHPGITKNGKDVICPKCKSPYCEFYYEERNLTMDRYKTKTKIHPLNPFKPFVEEKTRVIPGQKFTVTRYRCTKCGKIFD